MRLRLRIGALMKEKGVSIKELAARANIAQNTAKGLYHGITTRVDLPLLERVAAALSVRPLELFEESDDGRAPRLAVA